MLRRLAILSVFGLLPLWSGCAYFQANPRLVSNATEERIDSDLPMPQGFELDRSKSFKHERSDYRRFKLVYRQQEYLGEDRVREFFREHFPVAGWEIAFIYGLETSKFIFFKGPEECLVEVREDFGDRYTQIEVEVGPRKTPDGDLVAREPDALPAGTDRAETDQTVNASSSK